MSDTSNHMRDWDTLATDEQTALRIEHAHYLDSLPPTCSMETKIERFRNRLREHKRISYPA